MLKWVNILKNKTYDTQTETFNIGYYRFIGHSCFCVVDKRICRERFVSKIFHSDYVDGLLYRPAYPVDYRKKTFEKMKVTLLSFRRRESPVITKEKRLKNPCYY